MSGFADHCLFYNKNGALFSVYLHYISNAVRILISGEGLRTDVKYDGSRTSGLRHLSRLLTIIETLRFLQGQNLLEQQNYGDDDDDDQRLLWPSYEVDDDNDDDSGRGDRRLSAGSKLGTGHNYGFIPRSMLKRGSGSCVNSCMGRGMSFIRCKSMCN